MAEWANAGVQTVNPGELVIFSDNPVKCNKGLVLNRSDSGAFLLRGMTNGMPVKTCPCMPYPSVNYMVDFGANIAIPTGETVGPISVAFELESATMEGTEMIVNPAAVEEYFNVSRAANVPVWIGCCQSFGIRNTSSIPILVQNANMVITR